MSRTERDGPRRVTWENDPDCVHEPGQLIEEWPSSGLESCYLVLTCPVRKWLTAPSKHCRLKWSVSLKLDGMLILATTTAFDSESFNVRMKLVTPDRTSSLQVPLA